MKIISRAEARLRRLTRYFTGKPCPLGHVAQRKTTYGQCIECARAYLRAWRPAHPDKCRAYRRKEYVANPDRAAAWLGRDSARERFPDSIPPDFDYRTTIPFYAAARRLARETGIPHDVDHIVPLILGGKHTASNLQVLTAHENRKKARREQAEARRRKRAQT